MLPVSPTEVGRVYRNDREAVVQCVILYINSLLLQAELGKQCYRVELPVQLIEWLHDQNIEDEIIQRYKYAGWKNVIKIAGVGVIEFAV